METLILIAGVLLLLMAVLDMLSATFGTGGGFVARRLSMALWAGAVLIFERCESRTKRRFIQALGTGMCLTLLMFWLGCIIIGWAMIFGYDGAMTHQGDKSYTDWVDHLQFSVSTLSGLGRGMWKTSSSVGWELSGILAGLMGTFVISFAISFLIPIIQASKSKRVLAHRIWLLASNPIDLLNRYACDDPKELDKTLSRLSEALTACYQSHRAYPALHFMHSDRDYDSLGLNLVILDEALSLMKYASPDSYSPPPSTFDAMRSLLGQFFAELEQVYIMKWQGGKLDDLATEALLEPLELTDMNRERYVEAARGEELRKRRLASGTLLRNTGWQWEDVYGHIAMTDTDPLELEFKEVFDEKGKSELPA